MKFDRLKEIREDKDLTQKDIAKVLNVERSTYAGWETGKDTIPLRRLHKLSDYYKISIDYMTGLASKPTKYRVINLDAKVIGNNLRALRKSNNLTQKDITVGTEDIDGTATKKISISIDNKRFMELAEAIVDDLNKDEKAKEILDSFLENAEITTKESEEEVNISYSIFLEKDEIIRYSFNAKDSNEDYSIIFDDKNKSIILESAGEEILRGDITKEGNTITIDIIVNNENIGSISYGDTSTTVDLTFNTADNVAIMVNLNSTRTDNTINTNMEISASTGDYAITFLTLSDTCNITDGVADFSNINTTDSINLNDLTEEDLTTIQNRLMVVLYNYLGLDLSIYNTGLNI